MTPNELTSIANAYTELYNNYQATIDKLDALITQKENQLQRLRSKKEKASKKYPRWTDYLLKPVIKAIERQLPEWTWGGGPLVPRGIGCRVSVFFRYRNLPAGADEYAEGNSIYIVFQSGNLKNGELLFETGEEKSNFLPDTIGAINGFNNVTKPLETLEDAIEYLKKQIDTNKED